MVSEIQEVVEKYMKLHQRETKVPRSSYGRELYRDDGDPNKLYFAYLFRDEALAISFLQDAKHIRSKVLCDTCGLYMLSLNIYFPSKHNLINKY